MHLPRCRPRVLAPAPVTTGVAFVVAGLLLTGCNPPVGSQDWCAALRAKPTLEWTADEVKGYVDDCVVGDEE